jgi:hypothetical protein
MTFVYEKCTISGSITPPATDLELLVEGRAPLGQGAGPERLAQGLEGSGTSPRKDLVDARERRSRANLGLR